MNTDWGSLMVKRLRAAAANPPGAEVLRPLVDPMAKRAALNATRRGAAPRIQVRASRDRLTVQAQGRGAGEVLNEMRDELAKNRRFLKETLKAEAQRRLKGAL